MMNENDYELYAYIKTLFLIFVTIIDKKRKTNERRKDKMLTYGIYTHYPDVWHKKIVVDGMDFAWIVIVVVVVIVEQNKQYEWEKKLNNLIFVISMFFPCTSQTHTLVFYLTKLMSDIGLRNICVCIFFLLYLFKYVIKLIWFDLIVLKTVESISLY